MFYFVSSGLFSDKKKQKQRDCHISLNSAPFIVHVSYISMPITEVELVFNRLKTYNSTNIILVLYLLHLQSELVS